MKQLVRSKKLKESWLCGLPAPLIAGVGTFYMLAPIYKSLEVWVMVSTVVLCSMTLEYATRLVTTQRLLGAIMVGIFVLFISWGGSKIM